MDQQFRLKLLEKLTDLLTEMPDAEPMAEKKEGEQPGGGMDDKMPGKDGMSMEVLSVGAGKPGEDGKMDDDKEKELLDKLKGC
jgi:hypothetical protein